VSDRAIPSVFNVGVVIILYEEVHGFTAPRMEQDQNPIAHLWSPADSSIESFCKYSRCVAVNIDILPRWVRTSGQGVREGG